MTAVEDFVPVAVRPRLIALRHELHRHPELSFQEHETSRRLEAALGAAGAVAIARVAGTGLVARVRGQRSEVPSVAVRGDIDALPIHEATGAPFTSVHDGVMHACGHDVHAAWTVGAAHLLATRPAEGDVLIVLQPAEEIGLGAAAVLESGALDGVAAIVGAHVDLRFPLGQVVAEAGPLAAAADGFTIEVRGRGAHGARPHEGRDPIVAAAAVVTALQTVVARRTSPGDPAVVTVGTFQAGSAPNVIPETAVLSGTIRTVHPETRRRLHEAVREVADTAARAHGTEAVVRITMGTPPIVNEASHVAWARAAVERLLGAAALVPLPEPNLGGEDFAVYLERIPGCFLRIGARSPDGEVLPAHTPRFLPDDGAVLVGAAVLAETAREMSRAICGGQGGQDGQGGRRSP